MEVKMPEGRTVFLDRNGERRNLDSVSLSGGNGTRKSRGGRWKRIEDSKRSRTTVYLTPILEQHLAAFSIAMKKTKNEILREALEHFVEKNGGDPLRAPDVQVSYK